MIGIIDYGMGNIKSVYNALKLYSDDVIISGDIDELEKCDKLVFPGVGAFKDCMENINEKGLYQPIVKWVMEDKKPIIGICLGMQVFFEEGYENGLNKGFGFFKGKVIKMDEEGLRIPHIGWNSLKVNNSHPLANLVKDDQYAYFVHSYYASETDSDEIVAYCKYGQSINIPAIASKDNIIACQFHPEKSGEDGLRILKYFVTGDMSL